MTSTPALEPLWFTDEGAGPPVLLVHGWTCDSYDWSFQYEAFTARHRVIGVDLRGHGRSAVTPSGYSPEALAGDLADLIDRLGCGPVVAVGHSAGGMVVSSLSIDRPDLVRAVVSVDPGYGIGPELGAMLAAAGPAIAAPEGGTVAVDLLLGVEPHAPSWLRQWHRRRTLACPPHVRREMWQAMYEAPDQFGLRDASEKYLRARHVPVLAFHRLPETASWEQGLFRDDLSHAVSWEGTGHWLHQERSEDFNQLTLDWIAALP